MFFKKASPSVRGVPLGALEEALKSTTLKARRDGDTLVVQHERFVTRVEVTAPESTKTADRPISAIVTIRTELPKGLTTFLNEPSVSSAMNGMATLGAVTEVNGQHFVGSRLTIYEGEDAWSVQFGLVLYSVIASADTLMDAARRRFTRERDPAVDPSAWSNQDFVLAHMYLSKICVCTLGELSLSAEFGLKDGEISVGAGHRHTALWQMMANRPHPELGGGLLCLLNMPHEITDGNRLDSLIVELNRLEMQGSDLPPHFGAWCRGGRGNNPAYVSFLPNVLHEADGIAVNMSFWAMSRAKAADVMLQTAGVQLVGNGVRTGSEKP